MDKNELRKDLEKDLKKSFKDDITVGLEGYKLEFIPSGSLELDVAMGTGGFPRGRISILNGKWSSGKTTIALKTIANAQKMGLSCAFIDTERTFDIKWAKKLGINVKDLMVVGANSLESAGEALVKMVRSGAIDLIVFDSIAGTNLKSIDEGKIEDSNIGKKAKMLGHLMGKVTTPMWSNNVAIIFINQIRDSLNPYAPQPVMPGGHAVPFASSLTISLSSKKSEDAEGGVIVKAKITKNKLNVPFKETEFIIDGNGVIDEDRSIAVILGNKEVLETFGINKGGAGWYTFPPTILIPNEEGEIIKEIKIFDEEKKLQGEPAITELLKSNPEFKAALKEAILLLFTRGIEEVE